MTFKISKSFCFNTKKKKSNKYAHMYLYIGKYNKKKKFIKFIL